MARKVSGRLRNGPQVDFEEIGRKTAVATERQRMKRTAYDKKIHLYFDIDTSMPLYNVRRTISQKIILVEGDVFVDVSVVSCTRV